MSQVTENLVKAVAAKNAAVAANYLNIPGWTSGKRMRTREAAAYCGCSEGMLRALRLTKRGPPFSKLSYSVVVYDSRDLDEWLSASRVGGTPQAA